jgi:hypothetical protein
VDCTPFGPAHIGGLMLWLKADDGITLNGPNVSSWADQSGSGNNAVQNTGGNQPLYVANGLNGEPIVRFNGSSSFMELPSGLLDNYSALTFFIVCKPILDINGGIFAPSYTNSTGLEVLSYSGGYLRINGNILNSSLFTDNVFTSSDFTYNASATSIYKNSAALVTVSGGPPLTYNGVYALGQYSGGYYAEYDVAEIIIYSSSLSDTDRQTVENYLNSKYHIY